MKIDTHTHIILSNEDIKKIITDALEKDGYRVDKPADIDFIITREQYSNEQLGSCLIICHKEEKGK